MSSLPRDEPPARRGAAKTARDRVARRLAREPRQWEKVLLLVLAVYLPITVWQDRGAAIGILAFLTYVPLFVLGTTRRGALLADLRLGPVADALLGTTLLALLTFFAVLAVTEWSVALCAASSAAFAIVTFGAIAARRRRS